MDSRLADVVVDALDPAAQARFWAALLGWTNTGTSLRAPADDAWDLGLVFQAATEPKTVKNRIHLELATRRDDVVARALDLGARRLDLGQGDVPWEVLADPEGNEFCVLPPHPRYDTGAVAAILVEAADPSTLGRFWSLATGWPVEVTNEEVVALRSPAGQWLEFLRGDSTKRARDRVRFRLAGTDRQALLDAGATQLGACLVDPEGHEFTAG
ncbi:VOC family protein [Kutzneria sp. NPDC052558]|uniref:VOC family protein n=1 Tax=Kutzneria sp. NPDC052558 TaxID=3364121 RepID=UPI0037C86EA9